MLQNREVGGATMGVGRRASSATFGPYGYLSFALPVALLAVFFAGLALGLDDPLGLRWSWCALVFVVTISAVSRFAGRRGAETEALWRSGPRTAAYWTQRWAAWFVLGLILLAFLCNLAGLPVIACVMIGLALIATAAVAPVYFRTPPGTRVRPDRAA
ncbi:hypothetical protein [Leifsonia sp. LS-T14]|uniref:hypothetical protein n=1 Tax=unclassified Leifsonia TaxID=2663824 RepID=UPI0035A71F09